MGKYLLGWVLGVPLFVLVIIYFLMRETRSWTIQRLTASRPDRPSTIR